MASTVPNLQDAKGVHNFLSTASSRREWNSRIERVRVANNADYPSFFVDVVTSEEMQKIRAALPD